MSDRKLVRALDRVTEGEPVKMVAAGFADREAQMLGLAARLMSTERHLPSKQASARGLGLFLAQAEAARLSAGLSSGARRSPVGLRRLIRGGLVGVMSAAVVFAGAGTLAVAAASSLPGQAAYGLKLAAENAVVILTADPLNRASLEVEFAEQRLVEAQLMAAQGRGGLAVEAMRDYYSDLLEAQRTLQTASRRDPAWLAVERAWTVTAGRGQGIANQLTGAHQGTAAHALQAQSKAFATRAAAITHRPMTPTQPSNVPQPASPQPTPSRSPQP